ncbi:MAG: hypothetical protein HY327_00120 [Chloroflexi bacterium]|nr:hypothetical protein [Chloroflexota bacterium]
MNSSDSATQWLLQSHDPSVRFWTRIDVLDEPRDSSAVRAEFARIPNGERVRQLLSNQKKDGGFGVQPYSKWTGAHWRLVSLTELGMPATPRIRAAVETVLQWLGTEKHRVINWWVTGRMRVHASIEGNALAVCSRWGLARDARVEEIARNLIAWQWDDGGWNCRKEKETVHSSFYETLAPLWGLIEFHHATDDADARQAAERAAEFFLRHRLFRSDHTGAVIRSEWRRLHYPLYWHYDILQCLVILARLRALNDPRMDEALDIVEQKRLPNGLWKADAYYWSPRGKAKSNEVVNWGRRGPNEMITLNALRVLKSGGRLN